ncbi:hypothetical protein BCR34DRAFT_654405 [Clohesyomyces aquaticus]|uniref:N-acetyltransferase domain-containing protein n=1 Tax=Clohesyomyces aquaticus TaxID=1231657 RepID=A0A1Y2A7A9_9PLEO|nr:hypothetical protein BCR34DRAFT_654405 [Clohesyomyces aquaticus]
MFQFEEVTSDADFDELIPALWHSYSHPRIPFLPLLFPADESDPHGQETAIEKSKVMLLQAHHADPTGHWFKVTDSNTGKIVGGCRWHVNETNPYKQAASLDHQVDTATDTPYVAPTYEKGTAQEFASVVLGQVLNPRAERYVRPHTHYRKQGIGRMLVSWGVEKADEMQLESFLEATDMGQHLYRKFGFVVVSTESASADTDALSEEWESLQKKFLPYTWHCMWRPVGGAFVDGVTKLPW